MKVLAIDASPRRGPVSRSLELAANAARESGADVQVLRLAELEIRECTGCNVCGGRGACKIEDDLPSVAQAVSACDAVILGTRSYLRYPDELAKALLERFGSYFRGAGDRQHADAAEGFSAGRERTRDVRGRAVIITATRLPEPLASLLGLTTIPLRQLRATLAPAGLRTVGSVALTDTWRHPELGEWEEDQTSSLGRMLVGRV